MCKCSKRLDSWNRCAEQNEISQDFSLRWDSDGSTIWQQPLACNIILMSTMTMPWASYRIRKIVGLRMRRKCRERFPRHWLPRKSLVSDHGMDHGTCVSHVPWCMSGSLTRGGGENIPGIPGACATRNFTYLVRGPWHFIHSYIHIYFPKPIQLHKTVRLIKRGLKTSVEFK